MKLNVMIVQWKIELLREYWGLKFIAANCKLRRLQQELLVAGLFVDLVGQGQCSFDPAWVGIDH
jgi:hypothetical protein